MAAPVPPIKPVVPAPVAPKPAVPAPAVKPPVHAPVLVPAPAVKPPVPAPVAAVQPIVHAPAPVAPKPVAPVAAHPVVAAAGAISGGHIRDRLAITQLNGWVLSTVMVPGQGGTPGTITITATKAGHAALSTPVTPVSTTQNVTEQWETLAIALLVNAN